MKLCDSKMGLWIALAVALVAALGVADAFGQEASETERPAVEMSHE